MTQHSIMFACQKKIKSNVAWAHTLLRMLMGRTFHMLSSCKMAGVTSRADAAQLDMAATGYILLRITGTLFYFIIVASHFLSAHLTQYTSDVQQATCLLQVMSVWESKENICGVFCNRISTALVLTAVGWTEVREPWLTEDWNSGEYCAACRHAKRSEWRRDAICQIK